MEGRGLEQKAARSPYFTSFPGAIESTGPADNSRDEFILAKRSEENSAASLTFLSFCTDVMLDDTENPKGRPGSTTDSANLKTSKS